jgi:hypothetical protein
MDAGTVESTYRLRDEYTPKLKELVRETKAVGPAIEQASSLGQRALSGLGAGLTRLGNAAGSGLGLLHTELGKFVAAGAMVKIISDVINFGGQIQDLSVQLDLSASAVQRWKYAFEQSGSSVETFAASIGRMNDALVDGGPQTIAVLERVGVTLEHLRSMKPDEAFRTLGNAIMAIPDPMERSAAAMAIFGRGANQLIPVWAEMNEKMEAAPAASEAMIAALDAFGDSLNTLKVTGQVLLTAVMFPLAKFFEGLGNVVTGVTKELSVLWTLVTKGFKEARDQSIGFTGALESNKAAAEAMWKSMMPPGGPALSLDEAKVAAKQLEDQVNKNIEAFKKMTALMDSLMGNDAIASAQDYMRALQELESQGQRPIKSTWDDIAVALKRATDALEQQGKTGTQVYTDMIAKYREFMQLNVQTGDLIGKSIAGLHQAVPGQLNPFSEQVKAVHEAIEAERSLIEWTERYNKELLELDEAVKQYHESQSAATTDGIAGTSNLIASIHRMKAEWEAAQTLLNMWRKPDWMSLDMWTQISHGNLSPGNMNVPQMRGGGLVHAGAGMLVELHGDEIVTPKGAGGIRDVHLHVGTLIGSDRSAARSLLNSVKEEFLTDLGRSGIKLRGGR